MTSDGAPAGRDPFVAIATHPPALTSDQASELARKHYGLDVTAEPLVSERDQNFLLRTAGSGLWVLKIANAVEDPAVTLFQIDALLHIAAQLPGDIAVPTVMPTLDGNSHIRIEHGDSSHIVRVVSFLPGVPLGDDKPSPALVRDLGKWLARLDGCLENFRHAGEQPDLLWDMKRAGELRRLLPHVADASCRQLVEATVGEFEDAVEPVFGDLPWQVIHNDANPANILVENDAVSGLIDFGDMMYAPRIIELGVAGAYLRSLDGNPLSLIIELVHGYHSVAPLARAEINVLHTLIKTRLATTVTILFWRASLRSADDAYLAAAIESERTALEFLQRLDAIPAENAAQIYSQVCASAQLEL